MDQQNQQHPPMSGNDDLAKALNDSSLQFEETPMPGIPPQTNSPTSPITPSPADDDMKMPTMDPEAGNPDNEPFRPPTTAPIMPTPAASPAAPGVEKPHQKAPAAPPTDGDGELEELKNSALEELRPLVGKLKLPPEEKFDTLLLVIRSTDDQSLLEQAHAAAKEITDDTRRAQALLDVIKEIDYFSSKR